MGANRMFKKFRGISDDVLGGVLTNHATMVRAQGNALTMLLKERRFLLALQVVEVLALIGVLLRVGL